VAFGIGIALVGFSLVGGAFSSPWSFSSGLTRRPLLANKVVPEPGRPHNTARQLPELRKNTMPRGMLDSGLRGRQCERTMPLTDRDRKILDLEGSWWTSVCSKGSQIQDLGLSRSQYYSVLRRLVHSADALDHAPLVVRRLRRQQLERRRDRFEGHAAQPHRPRR